MAKEIAKELIIAKYGEIALKGLNKRTFEEILVKNVKQALNGLGAFEYSRAQSTLYIESLSENINWDEVALKTTKIFGLSAVQKCAVFPKDFEIIASEGVKYLEKALKNAKTFKVEAKRADKTFPLNTPAIQVELGGRILDAFPHLSVNVHNPEVTVILEIRDKGAYLNYERLTGAGGLPVGSSGSTLLMLSGGIDSPVAAFMLAKRGVSVDALHFQSPPYTSERALMKVESLCERLTDYLIKIKLHCVNFTEVQEAIRDDCPEEYSTVILRRAMIKASNIFARNKKYGALITGESLGQVASQTLKAIKCTDAVAELPVLRPLIGMDKVEIVNVARKIGTFEISTLPYEDCCTIFTPKHPKTKPRLSEIEAVEEKLNSSSDFEKLLENSVKFLTAKNF